MNKSELRKAYLAKQNAIPRDERSLSSQQIADKFFDNFGLENVAYIHCFIAINKFNEIDTSVIFQTLWEKFTAIETVVPRVDLNSGEIESIEYTAKTNISTNAWGIPEPLHSQHIETDKIDIVLVPGLCFDMQGHRVGYGKGYYDRFLSKCRPDCLKIGLSYFQPIEEIPDANELDVKLDYCITPESVLYFN